MTQKTAFNADWGKYVNLMISAEPPWKPGPHQVAFYEAHIREHFPQTEGLRALILGSTPQTRDLCARLGIAVTCLDAYESMYRGMSAAMKEKPVNDTLVLGVWEKLDEYFAPNSFDITFSDGTQTNMPLESWDKNFRDIQGVVKKGGLYCAALWGIVDITPLKFAQAFQKYDDNPHYFDSFPNKLQTFYGLFFGEHCYDEKKQACMWHELRSKGIAYMKKHDLPVEALQAIWPIPNGIYDDFIGEYNEIDVLPVEKNYDFIKPYFGIIDEFVQTGHHIYKFRKDFVLKPRK